MRKKLPRIIVTGACGFVGSAIAKRLLMAGYEVLNVDDLRFGNEKNLAANIKVIDFNDLKEGEINQYEILIHCATSNIIYAMNNVISTFQNNATNTVKLFQKFKGRIIYTSTASVYGQAHVIPTPEDADISTSNAYDQSKYIAELFLYQRRNYTTLRLSNVYGDGQRADNPFCGVIGRLCYNILNNLPVDINGDGLQTRDYTYIDDVVDAVMVALKKDALNTEINIATGRETNILDLIKIIEKVSGKKAKTNYVENRKIDSIRRRALDISKAKKILSWEPKISIEEGVKRAVEWNKKHMIING